MKYDIPIIMLTITFLALKWTFTTQVFFETALDNLPTSSGSTSARMERRKNSTAKMNSHQAIVNALSMFILQVQSRIAFNK